MHDLSCPISLKDAALKVAVPPPGEAHTAVEAGIFTTPVTVQRGAIVGWDLRDEVMLMARARQCREQRAEMLPMRDGSSLY